MSDLIMGKNTIKEVLNNKAENILKIFTSLKDNDSLLLEIKKKNIQVEFVSKHQLTSMVDTESHQGVIAKTKNRRFYDLKEFLKEDESKDSSLVLMLDSIYDPQNFGSILRAAECFSADAIVFSKNRGVDITPVVSKASSGASEIVKLIKVSNLASSLEAFSKNGFSSVATVLHQESKSLYDFKFANKTILIIGSEGEGIQKLLIKKSDHLIHIPMLGKIDSLNVSQATAVNLAYFRYQANLGLK